MADISSQASFSLSESSTPSVPSAISNTNSQFSTASLSSAEPLSVPALQNGIFTYPSNVPSSQGPVGQLHMSQTAFPSTKSSHSQHSLMPASFTPVAPLKMPVAGQPPSLLSPLPDPSFVISSRDTIDFVNEGSRPTVKKQKEVVQRAIKGSYTCIALELIFTDAYPEKGISVVSNALLWSTSNIDVHNPDMLLINQRLKSDKQYLGHLSSFVHSQLITKSITTNLTIVRVFRT
jgi:hypothetical protein